MSTPQTATLSAMTPSVSLSLAGQTALHLACQCGDERCDELLIQGTPVDVTDKAGSTPVHAASLDGHHDSVAKLVEKGWSCDAKDKERNTALHAAAQGGTKTPEERFMKEGQSSKAKNKKRKTPLDSAVERGNHEAKRRKRVHRRRDSLHATLSLTVSYLHA